MGKKIFASAGLLSLIAVAMIICPGTVNVRAVDNTATQETQTTTRVTARPVLSISITPEVAMEITPKSTGSYANSTAALRVSTNSRNGFSVYMNGVNGSTDLVAANGGDDKISTLSSESILENFPANTWGYYIGTDEPSSDSIYNGIPATTTAIKSISTSTEQQIYKIAFGAKIDTAIEAGDYSNSVIVSVVANPIEVRSLEDLTYMQSMTQEVCDATTSLEVTKRLIDYRDGTTYNVAKLKDGNCWMQENLAYTLSTQHTLTPSDSDVTRDWAPSENTQVGLTATADHIGNANSWHLPDNDNQFYYSWNAATAESGMGLTTDNEAAPDSICPKGWELPSIGESWMDTNGSVYRLLLSYNALKYNVENANKVQSEPISMKLVGTLNNNFNGQEELAYFGSFASYWSKNYANNLGGIKKSYVTTLYLPDSNDGYIYPATVYYQDTGHSIRCVAVGSGN